MLGFLNDTVKKSTVVVFRILLGCVFIFSGYAKAVDPLGGTYKIEDYLTSFGWDFFIPVAFVASILLSALEFLLGICMLLGANIRSTSFLTLLFMCVMTPLTLYIAVFNPVSDCGCFGDALKISNWATFWKNMVFITMAIVVFVWRKYSPNLFSQRTEWMISIYSGFFAIAISIYCFFNLPIIDFRPYKNGTDIVKAMEIPEDAPADKYETTFVYEKDGVQKEFTLDNYPKDDTTWKCVAQNSVLVEKGYEPPIHDLTMEDPDEGDIVDVVLADTGYTFLLVSPRMENAYTNNRKKVNDVYEYAKVNGYGFYGMTSTGLESREMQEYIVEASAEYPFVNTDEITLKTIVRSNPGLVLIKNGVVVNKWSNKNIPTFDKPLDESVHGQIQSPDKTRVVVWSVIAFIIPLVIVYFIDKMISKFLDRRAKRAAAE
ncbi:MAG: BT_3928 family protein [Paludibacteraceae bacterium]